MSEIGLDHLGIARDARRAALRDHLSIGQDIDKTISRKVSKPWWTKSNTKKKADTSKTTKKPKKVAEKCTVKDGKKLCKKPAPATGDQQG